MRLRWLLRRQADVPPVSARAHLPAIPAEHQALWARIEAFQLDEPEAEFPFSSRLSEQQDWSPDFTALAIREYKRFLFLSMVATHMVSPSLVIDEVWHLHLQYTQSYVEDLCVFTLGRFLHHIPSRGGRAEKARFDGFYQQTLSSYRAYFGEPPVEVWGPDNGRFVRKHGRDAALAGAPLDASKHTRGDRNSLARLFR